MTVTHDQLNAKLVLLLDDNSINNSNTNAINNNAINNNTNSNNNNNNTPGQKNLLERAGVDISGISPGGSPSPTSIISPEDHPSLFNHKGV